MAPMPFRILAAVAYLVVAFAAQAQTYPTKTIHMLVGFAPGGANDILARIVGQKLADSMGQPVVVENRPGAAGPLAGGELAKGAPPRCNPVRGATPPPQRA